MKQALFTGGGEMGALMGSIEWSKTAIGPVELWPQSLKTSISILLTSKHPIFIWWGPELIQFYNDAYRPILGSHMHPRAMGQRGQECWSEVWEMLAPLIQSVMERGESTLSESSMLPLDRNGYIEECYFNYAYSPIRDEVGKIGGIFAACSEMTEQVLGTRRLETLRLLRDESNTAVSQENVCAPISRVLEKHRLDIPFTLTYLRDPDGKRLRLAGSSGLKDDELTAHELIDLNSPESASGWSRLFGEVVRLNESQQIDDLSQFFDILPSGPWPEMTRQALAIPITQGGQDLPVGIFISGISPRRVLDDSYKAFLTLVAGQISTSLTNARASENERLREEALSEIARAKTEFFSNVSHEFRTPITLMLGPLEDNLSDPSGSSLPHRERDKLAYRNSLRLLKLVNSLLDFSSVEAGRITAVYRPTNLSQFTVELSSVFRSTIERAGLKLLVDVADLGEKVYVDRDMWEKIVLNLLSNAFKFTFKGDIAVSVLKRNGKAFLSVKDTGIGIHHSELPRLFERFHRVEGAQGRTHEGTGIGLALIQDLTKLHYGSISVQSELGVGTEFSVEIPLGKEHLPPECIGEESESTPVGTLGNAFASEADCWLPDSQKFITDVASTPVSDSAAISRNTGTRARILLADDNADMRVYLRNLLQTQWDVESVGDGETALNSAFDHPPDLVLTDVMMPKVDGLELLQRLKQNPKTQNIPVILLSARAGEQSRIEGLQAGADDYLIKPFSAKELVARIQTHLQIGTLKAEALLGRARLSTVFD